MNDRQIRLTSIDVAGYIRLKHSLIGVDKITDTQYAFVFDNTPEIEKDIAGFYSNTVKVSPSDYYNSLKTLKNFIHTHQVSGLGGY